ncbi:MAG: HD domain-containing protein [Gemmatimonadetes bacterium]|nr:HD domain-containing protein [Gemmatimonadota bacterium]
MAKATSESAQVAVNGGGFPLRAAGIDVGSNAMRLLVGEFTGSATWTVLAQQRMPVRLGACVFGKGRGVIEGPTRDAAIDALRLFRERMDALNVKVYRATATSAVREATNGASFVRQAWDEAGIELETITGGEEARLIWLATGNRIDVQGRQWVLVDLGGGSVEVALADGDEVLWAESHAMGSVRLLAEFGQAAHSPGRFRKLVGEYIHTLASRISLETEPGTGVIATGGNIEELASLVGADVDSRGVARLRLKDLARMIDRLAQLSAEERIEELDLRPDRADVILPAALVYERIAQMTGSDELIVPNVGLKEGLLVDAMHDALQHTEHAARQQRDMMTGAIALGRRYLFDEAHGRHVAMLAASLFDQLGSQHGLGERDRRILTAAGVLHDIGQHISYRKHHKHSYYLILNASLPDLGPRDTLIVALVARYHRRAEPSGSHDGYADLSSDERGRVSWLAALLRIADALDRQHLQHVRRVDARVEDEELHICVHAEGDVLLEEWAIEKKARLFTRMLGLDLTLEISEAS